METNGEQFVRKADGVAHGEAPAHAEHSETEANPKRQHKPKQEKQASAQELSRRTEATPEGQKLREML